MSKRRLFSDPKPDAPVDEVDAHEEDDADEEMPRKRFSRRHAFLFAVFVVGVGCFLYFVLPQLAGLQDTWDRIQNGDPWWLALALGLELLAFTSYGIVFHAICARGLPHIGWRENYQITLAGLAATRLFAAGGAGGVALTAWALRRAGMRRRLVATRMLAFMVVLYAVYMVALVVFGLGLYWGILPGSAPFALTALPAILGGVALMLGAAMTLVPGDFERRFDRLAAGEGRAARWGQRLLTVPAALATGVRTAVSLTRKREWGLLGALGWWSCDIGTLWASFHAFGNSSALTLGVLVMGYYVGMLANLLPLPGGVGGVEGGMIGAFIAFGVPAGLAVVAVLTYRAFSFWLPTIPGAIAYFRLRKTVQRWRDERIRTLPTGAVEQGVLDPLGTIKSKVS